MKIRLGFVSNSSSASYYVTIKNIDVDEFYTILNACYNTYELDDMFARYKEDYEQSVKTRKPRPNDSEQDWFTEFYEKEDETYNRVVLSWDTATYKEKFDMIFAARGSMFTVEQVDDDIEISDFTSMHNSYNDGLSTVLKEILLYFMFERDFKIRCRMEDHN